MKRTFKIGPLPLARSRTIGLQNKPTNIPSNSTPTKWLYAKEQSKLWKQKPKHIQWEREKPKSLCFVSNLWTIKYG